MDDRFCSEIEYNYQIDKGYIITKKSLISTDLSPFLL